MNTPTEDTFRDAYAVYERNHAEQRKAMLAALPQATPMKRRLGLRPALAALAAVLVVALGIAVLETIRATPAYGLDGLRERLQSLNSWHIKGYYFKRTKTQFGIATLQFPIERYYQRPSLEFHTGYGFGSQGNDNLVEVNRSYTVSDGQRSLLVLHNQKKAVLTTAVDPLQTELSIENVFQVSEIEELMSRNPAEFERVGTDRVDGKWCEIYQSKPSGDFRMLRRIWIDPSSGLPVRVKGFHRESNDEDVPDYEYTEIRTNVDPPPELFSFEVPEGFELTEVTKAPKVRHVSATGSCGGGNYRAANWVGINIDDRAVLVCWSQWLQEKDKQTFFHDKPQLVLEGSPDRICSEQKLYETISGELLWRWSLVVPNDNRPLGNKPLAIKFKHPNASISLGLQPLVFSEPRLSEMVEKVQRRSLEAAGDFSNVRSLKQLRESISSGTKALQP